MQRKILEQSIGNGWTGLFEIKPEFKREKTFEEIQAGLRGGNTYEHKQLDE